MNIKALVTTLVIGSSSVAMAKPAVFVSGEASVSVGYHSHDSQPVVHDHRPIYPQPIYTQPVYTPPAPVVYRDDNWQNDNWQDDNWQDDNWNDNSTVAASGSTYVGSLGQGTQFRDRMWNRNRAWFNLTEATRIDSNRQFFNLRGQQLGRFTQIQLQSLSGRTAIDQVAIEFVRNGVPSTQKVRLGSSLSRNRSSLLINLSGDSRDISRIIVYGESGRNASYQILAR